MTYKLRRENCFQKASVVTELKFEKIVCDNFFWTYQNLKLSSVLRNDSLYISNHFDQKFYLCGSEIG